MRHGNAFESYIAKKQKVDGVFDIPRLVEVGARFVETILSGGTIIVCGNGGSAATASHLVNDLCKYVASEVQTKVRAICLTDNVPLLTAFSNDYDYTTAFDNMLGNWDEEGNLLVIISGSGMSYNAVEAAICTDNCEVIGLLGGDGGTVKKYCNECYIVPSRDMQLIEDQHLAICHMICNHVIEVLTNAAN